MEIETMKVADYLTMSLESERIAAMDLAALVRRPADVFRVAEMAVYVTNIYDTEIVHRDNWACLLAAAKCIANGEGDVCDISTSAGFCRDELRQHAGEFGELPATLAKADLFLEVLQHASTEF